MARIFSCMPFIRLSGQNLIRLVTYLSRGFGLIAAINIQRINEWSDSACISPFNKNLI